MSQVDADWSVSCWLSGLRLSQYYPCFQAAGVTSLAQCRALTPECLEQVGVALPGHRRRIVASLGRAPPPPQDGGEDDDDHRHHQDEEAPPSDRPLPLPRERSRRGGGEGRVRPIPRERTKFRPAAAPPPPPDDPPLPTDSPPFSPTLPPVPPRSALNCPPQPFVAPGPSPSSPSTSPRRSRPHTLPLLPPPPPPRPDGPSPLPSPSAAKTPPPLPPKASFKVAPPPLPQRPPPQLHHHHLHHPDSSSLSLVDDTSPHSEQSPQVSPRPRTPQSPEEPPEPGVPIRIWSEPRPQSGSRSPHDPADDYEEPDLPTSSTSSSSSTSSTSRTHRLNTVADQDMSLQVPAAPSKPRLLSACSDEELLDGDDSEDTLRLSPSATVKDDDSELGTVVMMGWLEKYSPQGVLGFQKRWVRLEVDYLRYFEKDKEVDSKGFICTASITHVNSVGDVKFEVVTNNRTFVFRADSEARKNSWVMALHDCVAGRHPQGTVSALPTADHQGYLDFRGFKGKVYVVVAADKVFLYKTQEDQRIGVGITYINMNVGNVKETDQRSFDLTTPYRLRPFSFVAESEQQREQWVEAMRGAIDAALSNCDVAEQIWAEPSNSRCADCGAAKPEWAAINLCVVVCSQCAGEHRGLGPSISKVRSLKMDKKVWTEELIQIFLLIGNERANTFWAQNVPPSEALSAASSSADRRSFISNKYRQGKYRNYHPLFGHQRELDSALCMNVQSSDLLETLSLIFCGADVHCSTQMATWDSPLALAAAHSQSLQAELIGLNLNTELPRLDVGGASDPVHYSAPPCVSHNGFLFKTASVSRAVAERKAREEFTRRWCSLNDGCFSYYESDKSSAPNGTMKSSEIVCVAVNPPDKHGYEHTFELYSESKRLYLFGTDEADSHRSWVKSIAKSFIPPWAEPLLSLDFERIGRLKCKDGLNLQTSRVGWFALVGSTLHAHLAPGQQEELHLRRLSELSIQRDNEVIVLVKKGRTLYIEGERKLDFAGWCSAIEVAGRSGEDTLTEQQLTEDDVPVTVHSCISYITQCGLTSEGIYRKSGVNSRVAALDERFRRDARSLCLRDGENQVDDVSNTLKRFFRDLKDGGLFTQDKTFWLSTTGIQDEGQKISQYRQLLCRLPPVHKATLQALIHHLHCVQCFSERNQMQSHALAIVFGPTLFQTDGQDYSAGRAIEDLIEHYTHIFQVDEQRLKRDLEEIKYIIKLRDSLNTKFPASEPGGHFLCTVYLNEKTDEAEGSIKIPGAMTAAELCSAFLNHKLIPVKEEEFWSCWEVSDKEETERPLHYRERPLPLVHSSGTNAYLIVKNHLVMRDMVRYLADKKDVSKSGSLSFKPERNILGLDLSSFDDRYFILNSSSLRMFKDVLSNSPEREWPAKNLQVYLGIKKRLHPPTCWGLTVVCERKKHGRADRQQCYLCCTSRTEMIEWFASFYSVQNDGDVWPKEGLQRAVCPGPADLRLGVSGRAVAEGVSQDDDIITLQ
ncbi:arf-GAP with Rho-GAP domain, ANK repeat and PH domain-containing protein 1 isoform X4 [Nelusetta ayraudi]|uniref:arf-GAP with Rho-GAP domain, ANK repeat and PH domain-containing protein 1 isoform X4 n=1 Tax=Nelusetta ayraudi TaxID=303726 RepID=UPI003F71DEF1